MITLRILSLGLGTLFIGLAMAVPVARADFGDALIGAAVGAGVVAATDDDDDGYYVRRRYRSFSPYSYGSYPYRYRYWSPPVYRYRSFSPGLPFGAAYYIDEGAYRNYKDAYGNHLGRRRLW